MNIIQNSKQSNVDFKHLATLLLPQAESRVSSWLPDGKRQGDEWVARNPKRADENLGSFKINLLTGLWSDFATGDKGSDLISLFAYLNNCEQHEAFEQLGCGFGNHELINTRLKLESETWNPILPAPDDVQKPNFYRPEWGMPKMVHEYRDENGKICSYICRYETDGGKSFLPWTFGSLNGKPAQWEIKAIPENRPLYRLPELLIDTNKTVLVVEGEKTTDLAINLFKESYCVVTSMMGAKSPQKTNWTSLVNRDVLIWPDNDDNGYQYASGVAKLASKAGAKSVRIVQIPKNIFPTKWDLANPFPNDVNFETITQLLLTAPSYELLESHTKQNNDESTHTYKEEFQIVKEGINRWSERGKKKADGTQNGQYMLICSPIEIIGKVKAIDGSGWSLYLKWQDEDNGKHDWEISLGCFQKRDSTTIVEHLAANGLKIMPRKGKDVIEYLEIKAIENLPRLIRAEHTGWIGDKYDFLLPNETKNQSTTKFIFKSDSRSAASYSTSGCLIEWNNDFAKNAIGNSLFAFILCTAFVPPLIKILNLDNSLFHLEGASSRGKTTMLICAASVCGHPKSYIHTWNMTKNGFEGICAMHNDMLLCLDELGSSDPEEIGKMIYACSQGGGKERMKQSADGLRERRSFRLFGISTGESSLQDHMQSGKRSQKVWAGQEVRFISLQAELGEHGVFETLHAFKSGKEFSDHLKAASIKNHGVAIRAFIENLQEELKLDPEEFEHKCRDRIQEIELVFNVNASADPQVKRVGNIFAVVAMSGELACEYGVLNWPNGIATANALKCFQRWIQKRGGIEDSTEIINGIKQVAYILKKHTNTNFDRVDDRNNIEVRAIQAKWGFIKLEGTGNSAPIEYYAVDTGVFKRDICKEFDAKAILNGIDQKGYLDRGDGKNLAKKIKVPGLKSPQRMYTIRPSLLSAYDDADEDTHV